ncbi:site-specific integrase [Hyphomicrobium sp.]|uniref:tyrosine-type recombinase/integrase n=1 Tax=Hyphomicrobium sp. TaxID=82 RepID=UPI001DEE8681|nr:site-specific integrase [Hyphomicrobium sp.]MBY0561408.1 site-specific integrase [Hyphomicrobium sp.]
MPHKPRPSAYIYKRGDHYWFEKRVKGKKIQRPLETRDYRTAQKRRDKLLEELEASNWGEIQSHSFNAAVLRFGREHFPTLKPKSAKRYLCSLDNLLAVFDGLEIRKIDSAKLMEFEVHRREEDEVTNSTIRRDLACLSVLFGYAVQWKWTLVNPVTEFIKARSKAGLKNGAPRERYLTHDEEFLILNNCRPGVHDAIAVAIDTGLRKEEQCALEWTDVDFKAREVHVRAEVAKGRRARFVPLQDRSLAILKRLWAARRNSPYVFTTQLGERFSPNSSTFWEGLQVAAQRSNITNHLEWHDLRRTCGCRLLQDRKMPMEEVAKWLGHSSVKVTERCYAFLAKDALHQRLAQSEAVHIPTNGGRRKVRLAAPAEAKVAVPAGDRLSNVRQNVRQGRSEKHKKSLKSK